MPESSGSGFDSSYGVGALWPEFTSMLQHSRRQASFSSSCAAGGYAIDLADLVKVPPGSSQGFISPDLGANDIVKSGYQVKLAKDAAAGVTDVGSTTACNGMVSQPATSYFAAPIR